MNITEINTIKKEMVLTIIEKTKKEKQEVYKQIQNELRDITEEIKKKDFSIPFDLISLIEQHNNFEYIVSEVLLSELEKYE